jgi:hypothetical protein
VFFIIFFSASRRDVPSIYTPLPPAVVNRSEACAVDIPVTWDGTGYSLEYIPV